MKRHIPFLSHMIALGLAIAFIAVYFFPEWLAPKSTPVTMREKAKSGAKSTSNTKTIASYSYADAVAQAAPAVVNVSTAKEVVKPLPTFDEDPFFNPFLHDPWIVPQFERTTSLGSGVIISPKGYILTNNHVIAGADQIKVVLPNGRRLEVKAIGADPETDIAVLKADAKDLPVITVRQSKLRVGDVVLAIGNPFSIGQTVTQGIISATGRNQLGLNTIEDFIQTDAAINPGSSGGALIDAHGHLIGINTAIFNQSESTGIGFAIPVHLAKDVMTQIIKHGQVIRGWMGVEGIDVPQHLVEELDLPNNLGVFITHVIHEGPGEQAGLKKQDIILKINSEPINGVRDALSFIARSAPGTTLTFSGLRNNQPLSLTATVSIRPLIH